MKRTASPYRCHLSRRQPIPSDWVSFEPTPSYTYIMVLLKEEYFLAKVTDVQYNVNLQVIRMKGARQKQTVIDRFGDIFKVDYGSDPLRPILLPLDKLTILEEIKETSLPKWVTVTKEQAEAAVKAQVKQRKEGVRDTLPRIVEKTPDIHTIPRVKPPWWMSWVRKTTYHKG